MRRGHFLVGALLSIGLGAAWAGAEEVTLRGTVRDVGGTPVDGILLNVSASDIEIEARSAEDGSFAVDVPDLELPWTISLDEAELIALGYFCFPAFIWQPGDPVDLPELTTVPLRPEISLERGKDGVSCVRLDFDWVDGITPIVLQEYSVERSIDMKNWERVMTVGLACPPIEFFDETQRDEKQCYYRTVPIGPTAIGGLDPEEFEFIADPALGWEGDPILVFDPDEPLPDSLIVAPEIFLRPGE